MNHDDRCEIAGRSYHECKWSDCQQSGPHCHCGSRAFPLCVACRHGQHRQHTATDPDADKPCACDLCPTEEAA